MRHWLVFAMSCVLLLSHAAPGFPDGRDMRSDVHIFLEGLAFSYNGEHKAAQQQFGEYKKRHPDDLLVQLRILYDNFFANKENNDKLPKEKYWELLRATNDAVNLYERKQCVGTDIKGLTGDTVDCASIGAALYSFRMLIVGTNDSWFNVVEDKNKFAATVATSSSAQGTFLLGIYEYAASQRWAPARWGLHFKYHVPTDENHAAELVLQALARDKSPFRDDILFFVLDTECHHADKKPAKMFEKYHSLQDIFGDLTRHYPNNKKIRDCPRAQGASH